MGVINPQGKLITPIRFDEFGYITWGTDSGNFRIAKLVINGSILKGVVNVSSGNIIIPPVYSDVRYLYNKIAPFKAERPDGSSVLLNFRGLTLPFSELYAAKTIFPGTFLCKSNGRYGACREDGSLHIPVEFDTLFPASSGLALAKKDNGYLFLKPDGKVAFDLKFSSATIYRNGISVVSIDSLYGIINTQGKWVKKPFANAATRTNDLGYFAFKQGDNIGIMGPKGTATMYPECQAGDILRSGNFLLYSLKGNEYKVGLTGEEGNLLLPPLYSQITNFMDNGLAVIKMDDKAGLVDLSGKILVNPKYDEIYAFEKNGVAVFKLGNKYGLINSSGTVLYPPLFDNISSFDVSGLAIILNGNYRGAINQSGTLIIPSEYLILKRLDRGYYKALKDSTWILLDSAGKVVIPDVGGSIEKMSLSGMIISKSDNKYGLWTSEGNQIFEHRIIEYSEVGNVGLAIKLSADGYHFINSRTLSISPNTYIYIAAKPTGNLIQVNAGDSKLGFINLNGEEIITPRFRFVASSQSSISLLDEEKIGFIDFDGRWVLPLKYDYSLLGELYLDDGICKVARGNQLFYVDSTGREYYSPYISPSHLPQGMEIHPQRGIQQIQMKSSDGKEYIILVGLPEDYLSSNKKYPVLYLTDADYLMGSAWEMVNILSKTMEIPEFIIIGIAYGGDFNTWYNRRIDEYCPTRQSYTMFKGGGESLPFEAFLANELKPFVDSNFRTLPELSTYTGYSFGGLFGASLLIHKPDLFKDYILISPSIWWDNGLVLKQAEKEIGAEFHHDGSVFISLGEKEMSSMLSEDYYKLLLRKNIPGLLPEYHTLEGQTHNSTFHSAMIMALKSMYGF
jgi:predicted alpha/beta superfamily hydrolase